MNGIETNSPDNVLKALETVTVGTEIRLSLLRSGKEMNLTYTVPERPLLPGDISGQGLTVPLQSPAYRQPQRRGIFQF
jgi:hypothetical protein